MNEDPKLSEAELMCVFDTATGGAAVMTDTQFETFYNDPSAMLADCNGATYSPTVGATLPPTVAATAPPTIAATQPPTIAATLPPTVGATHPPTPQPPTAADVFAVFDTNSDQTLTGAEWIAGELHAQREEGPTETTRPDQMITLVR